MKKFINLLLISIILLSLTAVTGAHASGTAFSISGQVVDRYGNPLPGASVTLIDFNYKTIGTRTTGDTGNFDFVNVVAETDTCTVQVSYTDSNGKSYPMPQYFARWYPTKGIQVIPSKETQIPTYPEPTYGYVYGAIQTSTGNGASFINGIVYLVSMDNDNKYYEFADRTDGKGSYSFYTLPGTYRLYAQHWENGVCYESTPKQITVGRNADQTDPNLVPTAIILPLTNPTSTPDPADAPVHHDNRVYGNVTTKDGKPWAGATVTLFEQSDNGSGYIPMKGVDPKVTDSNGHYEFYGVAPTTDDGVAIQSKKNVKVMVSYTDLDGKPQTITMENRDSRELYYPDIIMGYGAEEAARNVAMPTVTLDFAQSGWVNLKSTPSGAFIYVDGQQLYGPDNKPLLTPAIAYIDAGDHEIKMGKEGYQDNTAPITMVANKENTDFTTMELQKTLVPQWVTAAVAIIILLIVVALIIALLATRIKGLLGPFKGIFGSLGHKVGDYKANRDVARAHRVEMAEQKRFDKQMRAEEKMDYSRREPIRMRPEGAQASRDDVHVVNVDPMRKKHDPGLAEGGKKKILDIDLKQITGSVPKKTRPRDVIDSQKERSPVVFANDIYKKSNADIERIPYESAPSRPYEQPPSRSHGSSGGGWSYGPETEPYEQPYSPSYRTETYDTPSRSYSRSQPVDEREALVERPSMPERNERFRVPRTSGQRDPGSSTGEKDRVLRYIRDHAEGVSFIQMSNDLEIIPNNLTYITKELVINDDIEKVKGLYYYKSHSSSADEKSSSVVVWRLDADK